MKKIISLLLVFIIALSCITLTSYAGESIKVSIDGKEQSYDVMPVIVDSRTLVPMRGIFEALGATILWDDATKTVTGTKGDTKVILQIGNREAKVNDNIVSLDVPATIVSDRTMVPVRFISESLGCKVDWDDATKTVIISSSKEKLAKLVSEDHRNIPTEFEKTADMKDMHHFGGSTIEEQEKQYELVKKDGEVVCTTEEFIDGLLKVKGEEYGSYEVVDVKDQVFKKAVRITCNEVPNKSADFIVKTSATPEKNPGDGVKAEDQMILCFRMRTVSGGDDTGNCKIQVQVEETKEFKKALFDFATAGSDWQVIYMPFKGVENATSIGIRPGFFKQIIEIGGIEILNFGPDYDISKLPKTQTVYPELELDSKWREDALKRIEEIRKGDFAVVVKDKDGNVIPDANVTFDMFEHEFQFGTSINASVYENEEYAKKLNENFNTAVVEHMMKWGPYERNPEGAMKQFDGAVNAGIKYMRGHSLIWELALGSDGKTYLTPEYMFTEPVTKDRALFDQKIKDHIYSVCKDFYGRVTEWDVVNQIVTNHEFRDVYEDDTLFKTWFEWARDAAGDDVELYYNETHDVWTDEFFEYLDKFKEMDVDYDGIGIQSHYESYQKMPSEQMALYERLRNDYDKRIKVTEFSCSIEDENLQANYLRDSMIVAFAEPNMDGFLMWGFFDGSNFEAHSPIYDTNWNLKKGGKVYQDLVYNKWWTKDAKATTDAEGKASVRGYYGDYDVTVEVNGKTATKTVAFHKGYDNELEITVE
ncbi:MAG: hypothetical protein E7396_07610 [Ruminococcaceae bacterium]|nr:hypothetical protein [Oscillospiraceae bacterium]